MQKYLISILLKILVRILLTFSSTVWMLVVYACKSNYTIGSFHILISSAIYISCSVILSYIVLLLTKLPDSDTIPEIRTLSLADNEYIPVYLGYFFAALSVNNNSTMIIVYILVFFMIIRTNLYFNPAFLLMGYHYFHVTTINGTEIFLISKQDERNPENIKNLEVKRINDVSYISH